MANVPGKPHRTAEIEAYEEAGILGKASTERTLHRKRKGKRKINCDIELFPLEINQQKRHWPERGQRDAIWLPAREAARLVRKPELGMLIARFSRRKKRKLSTARTG
jgi:hypothetical protein